MLVSNGSLLNILLANNDNKVLKDVLKNADKEVLNNIKKDASSIKDILKNLFTELKTGNKTNTSIENILKNSNLFKDLGSFTKSVNVLISQSETNPQLAKYKPLLESFLKNIDNLDGKSLKEMILKSGIFLESKSLEQLTKQSQLPRNIESLLLKIKNVLKDINTPEAKNIQANINKILQNNKTSLEPVKTTQDIKQILSQLENLTKNIGDKQVANLNLLSNNLVKVLNEAQLLESKIANQSNIKPSNIKTLTQSVNTGTKSSNIEMVKQNIDIGIKINNIETSKQNLNINTKSNSIETLKQHINNNIKEVLIQLKNQLIPANNIPNKTVILKQIDSLLNLPNLFSKNESIQEYKLLLSQLTKVQETKPILVQQEAISKNNIENKNLNNLTSLTNSLKKVLNEIQILQSNEKPTNIETLKQNINSSTKEILTQLKNELINTNNIPNKTAILKQIDSLLNSPNLFSKNENMLEPKELLKQLTDLKEIKTASIQSESITKNVANLKSHIETINNLEAKVLKNENIQIDKTQLLENINQTLKSLKTELMGKNIDSKPINQLIDKLFNLQNIFNKIEIPMDFKSFQTNMTQTNLANSFQSNFSSNINNIILSLKDALSSIKPSEQNGLNFQQNIIKNINSLESGLNNFLQVNSNTHINDKNIQQNPLQNDMKAVLLQMQEELSNKTDIKSIETIKQIDKMITQIEYFQLLSSVSNSNSVYIPFIWDILDEGSISMKKLDKEKFYCEINLSLKEFGQTQLMLALYDKNKLDLTVYASKDSFKGLVKKNLTKLKQALNHVNLVPINIKIIDFKKEESKKEEQKTMYNQNNDISLGLNIRV